MGVDPSRWIWQGRPARTDRRPAMSSPQRASPPWSIKDAGLFEDIARLVNGVVNIEAEGRILLILDPAELLTRAERGLLDKLEGAAQAPS